MDISGMDELSGALCCPLSLSQGGSCICVLESPWGREFEGPEPSIEASAEILQSGGSPRGPYVAAHCERFR